MASGYFTGTTGNKYITARIEWSSTPNTIDNRSSVTATLSYKKSSSSTGTTYGTGSFSITINGSTHTFSVPISLNPDDTWVRVGSHSVQVTHNTDGSKSIAISASGGIPGLTFSTTNCSATVILDKIPRASIPAFTAAEFNIGGSMTVVLYPSDPSFRHTVTYAWGASKSGIIGTNIADRVTWNIPENFAEDIPYAVQGTLSVTVETFTPDGTSLGKVTRSTPCNVQTSVKPTITAITLSDTGGNVPSSWGVYVRGKSRLHVKVEAQGVYNSRIMTYNIRALGMTVTANDTDIGIISDTGTVNVEVTVIDSRGRTVTSTESIKVLDYKDPAITRFHVERANNAGTPVDNGDFAKIALAASGSSVDTKNTITAKIYHMRSDLSSWTLARTITVAYNIDQIVMIGDMVTSRSYAMKVELSDTFGTTIAVETLKAEGAVMGWYPGGIGISFGKAAEEEYTADFDWIIHGRKGARFDENVDVPSLSVGGSETLQTIDIVTIGRDSNLDITQADAYVGIAMNQIQYSATSKLQLASGGVAVPVNVRGIRVSAQIAAQVVTPGARFLHIQIVRGSTYITISRTVKFYSSSTVPESMVISPIYISAIQPGDIIVLGMYGQNGDVVYSTNYETFMTVEAYA